jgi:L-lactate utilization protein LutB
MTEPISREKLMTDREPLQEFWRIRLDGVKTSLEKNNFEAFVADSSDEARRLVMEDILSSTGAKTVSWGGCMTMEEIGLGEALRGRPDLTGIDPMEGGMSMEHMRKAFSADLFFAGANAVTQAGQLVNLDMLGNRISAISFGPTHVAILAGRNKIVPDLEAAMDRIRKYVSPAHARRVSALGLEMDTPCMKTATCNNCNSPTRICNAWSIIEKSFPPTRIKVVLINEDLGV